jgi:Spy/CpxP family protein refolding chaperone
VSLMLALALCAATLSVSAQNAPDKPVLKGRFEVLHMLYNSVQVRIPGDENHLRTFVYSDAIRDKMQKLFDKGGYQYGDKVEIWYRQGTDVALKIKGKPSKPL